MERARHQSFYENFEDWSRDSTLKSVRNIATWRQIPCKFLWLGLTLASIGACAVNIYFIVDEFLEYNKDTNIQLKNTVGSVFPAVTG